MDTRIHQCLIWTFAVSRMLIHADIGCVHVGLRYQLQQCLCNSPSFHNCLAQQLWCIKSSLLRCLMFHDPRADPHTEIRPFCGVINTGKQLISYTWNISVPSMFSLYINFLHFNLPMSPNCEFGTKVSVMVTNNYSEQTMYTFCGHRVPWDFSFLQSQVTLMCDTENTTPKGFHFVMTFQAFDIMLPSIGLIQLNEYEEFLDVGLVHFAKSDSRSRHFTFAYLSIGQQSRFSETEIQIHIIVVVSLKIRLHSSPEEFARMTIYDGPGILSPVISPGPKSTYSTLSSYQAYIKYSNEAHGGIISTYKYANSYSHINSTTLSWTVRRYLEKNCDYFNDVSVAIRTQSHALCYLEHSTIITIHQMKFTGFNMLRHSPSIFTMTATCQYGGLFVLKRAEYFKIRTDAKNRFVVPITIFNRDVRGSTMYGYLDSGTVVFVTFPGYSRGFVHLTIVPDTDCYGTNIAIARGPSCNNYLTFWDDKHGTHIEGQQCTDAWLMNDIDYKKPSPFEKCSFVLDHANLGTLAGPFKMITGASTSVIYHTAVSVYTDSSTWIENLNIDIYTSKDLRSKLI